MKIADLKNNLINNKISDDLIIFETAGNSEFLVRQYVNSISNIKNKEIRYIQELPQQSMSLLDFEEDTELKVFRTDELELSNDVSILGEKNLIIITSKVAYTKNISKDVKTLHESYIVKLPILEEWQIIDYIMSTAEGITEEQANWLYKSCNGSMDKLEQEVNKISNFSNSEIPVLFKVFANDKIFNAIPNINVFSFSHALSVKDMNELSQVFYDIDYLFPNMSADCMKIIGLLYKEFKNLTAYQTSRCPTPENTGIPSKQFWVYEKKPKKYNINQLINIFSLLSDMDRRIKNGEFPTDTISIADYLTIKILNA